MVYDHVIMPVFGSSKNPSQMKEQRERRIRKDSKLTEMSMLTTKRTTYNLLLITIGWEALFQNGTVLQEDFVNGL